MSGPHSLEEPPGGSHSRWVIFGAVNDSVCLSIDLNRSTAADRSLPRCAAPYAGLSDAYNIRGRGSGAVPPSGEGSPAQPAWSHALLWFSLPRGWESQHPCPELRCDEITTQSGARRHYCYDGGCWGRQRGEQGLPLTHTSVCAVCLGGAPGQGRGSCWPGPWVWGVRLRAPRTCQAASPTLAGKCTRAAVY